ncbi:MAG: choice-of-anchor Q domain-containing protein [Verrucomicrobiales bacterium]
MFKLCLETVRRAGKIALMPAFIKRVLTFVLFLTISTAGRADVVLTSCTEKALRSAIASGGIIQLNCASNRISINSPIVISVDTTLVSTQQAMALLTTNNTRMFVINPGVKFTVQNLGLFGGKQTSTNAEHGGVIESAGGAIYNNGGTVTLLNSTFAAHSAIGFTGKAGRSGNEGERGEHGGDAAGGAIYNKSGMLVISNCVFEANTVTGGPGGVGGAGNIGAGATAGWGGNGGKAGGGAIYSENGTVLIYNTLFTNNIAMGAVGGSAGAMTSPIGFTGEPGDSAGAFAGALFGDAAYIVLNNCTFTENSAIGANGSSGVTGNVNKAGSKGKPGGFAAGGAILNRGALYITNCTFTLNESLAGNGGAGGVGGPGAWGNEGGKGGDGGVASGGAIESNYQTKVVNCTFASNAAEGGSGGAGGAGTVLEVSGDHGSSGSALGGALFNANPAEWFEIGNTILANSPTGGNVAGALKDLGGNISSDFTFLFTAGTSRAGIQPGIAPLSNNGGLTPTMAISSNSLAYNQGLSSLCPPTDQRGSNRVDQCDIGAFELILTNNGTNNTNTNSIATNAVPLFVTKSGTNLIILQWSSRTNVVLERSSVLVMSIIVTNISTNTGVPFPGGLIETDIFLTNIISTNWSPVTNGISTLRGQNFVTVQGGTNEAQFFRLRRP